VRLPHRHRVARPRRLALLETVPGQVTLSVFARKVGMSEAAMRAELLINPPLVDYFVKSMRQGMAEMEAA
jgi:hypothetical protein